MTFHIIDKHATKCRNSSVELLRFGFMYLIVLLHVYGHGSGLDYEMIYNWGTEINTMPHLFLFSLGKIGVTGFMFISGYYGIRTNRNRILDMIIIPLFYLIVLMPIGKGCGKLLLLHPFDGWWFISAYVFIMLLAPIIETGIKNISSTTFRNVVFALLVYTYFAKAISSPNSRDVVLLLTIYLAARYFKLECCKYLHGGGRIIVRCVGIFALLLFTICPVIASNLGLPLKFFDIFVQNNNPLLLIITGWLVYEADTHRFSNRFLNSLLRSTIAIYIITDAGNVRQILTTTLLPKVMEGFVGYVDILLICLGCLLIDQIRLAIFQIVIIGYKLIKSMINNEDTLGKSAVE